MLSLTSEKVTLCQEQYIQVLPLPLESLTRQQAVRR